MNYSLDLKATERSGAAQLITLSNRAYMECHQGPVITKEVPSPNILHRHCQQFHRKPLCSFVDYQITHINQSKSIRVLVRLHYCQGWTGLPGCLEHATWAGWCAGQVGHHVNWKDGVEYRRGAGALS